LTSERLGHGFLQKIVRREGCGRCDDLHVSSVYVAGVGVF
jgi:hypothetical protein